MLYYLRMRIEVRVKPNSRSDEVQEDGHCLTVRVKEAPVEGKANKAVVRLLAKHLGVAEDRVHIIRGLKSRSKVIEVT